MSAPWIGALVAVWLLFAFRVGVIVGRGIRLADRREPGTSTGAGSGELPAPAEHQPTLDSEGVR